METVSIFLGVCLAYAIVKIGYIVLSLLLLKFNKPKEREIKLTECLTPIDGLNDSCGTNC